MWRELCHRAVWGTEGPPWPVCPVEHTCLAAARTHPLVLTDLQQTYSEYRFVSAEHLWRVLADRVQKGQRVSGWSCHGTLRQDNRSAQGDVTSPCVVSR